MNLDLHNNYDLLSIEYNIEQRFITIIWQRSYERWVPPNIPETLRLLFKDVSLFKCRERDKDLPYTEDSCLSFIGLLSENMWKEIEENYSNDLLINEHLIMIFQSDTVFKIKCENVELMIK